MKKVDLLKYFNIKYSHVSKEEFEKHNGVTQPLNKIVTQLKKQYNKGHTNEYDIVNCNVVINDNKYKVIEKIKGVVKDRIFILERGDGAYIPLGDNCLFITHSVCEIKNIKIENRYGSTPFCELPSICEQYGWDLDEISLLIKENEPKVKLVCDFN